MAREQVIKNAGYKLITIWENDWKKQQKEINNGKGIYDDRNRMEE